jgi:hypothetical protein
MMKYTLNGIDIRSFTQKCTIKQYDNQKASFIFMVSNPENGF